MVISSLSPGTTLVVEGLISWVTDSPFSDIVVRSIMIELSIFTFDRGSVAASAPLSDDVAARAIWDADNPVIKTPATRAASSKITRILDISDDPVEQLPTR
ncbi:hypothetical protein SPHINGOR109_10164 [Sphingorhabdus sp. 109]|nr:hypothetical protein SPHINGOR109_10164 [Sphingorhabdus sp. 109]